MLQLCHTAAQALQLLHVGLVLLLALEHHLQDKLWHTQQPVNLDPDWTALHSGIKNKTGSK